MRVVVYSYTSPGYDNKIDDGRLYLTLPKEICKRFNNTRMPARIAKALPHIFLDTKNADACLWLDSNIQFREGYNSDMLIKEYFEKTEHCGVFAHTERTTIDQEIAAINTKKLDHPSLTSQHFRRIGKLAWTGILYRTFTPEVIRANNMWWAEISTKSSRDQLSFPYSFDNLIDYKDNPDLETLGKQCWSSNSKWYRTRHKLIPTFRRMIKKINF